MSMNKINRDLASKPLVLKTKSGCYHYHDPNTKEKDSIIIEQQWDPHAYTIEKIDNYLAINFWKMEDNHRADPYKVASFNNNKNAHLARIGNKYPHTTIQLRIYPNRKAALVHEHRMVVNGVEQVKTYVENDMETSQLGYQYWRNNGNLDAAGYFENILNMSDKEIEAAAKTLKKDEVTYLINFVDGRLATDLSDKNEIIAFNQGDRYYVHLANATIERVDKFFGDKQSASYGKITTLEGLMRFSYYKDTNNSAAVKRETDLFKSIMEPHKQRIRVLEPRTQYWFRTDTFVGCYIKSDRARYYDGRNNYSGSDWVFLYNYKTRSRILMKYNLETGEYTKNIPSLSALDDFNFGPRWTYTYNQQYGSRERTMERPAYKVVIAGSLSLKELFANTNVGYLLDNNPNFKLRDLHSKESDYENRVKNLPISSIINLTSMQRWVLTILGSSNNPVLEMFLKSKMYNLYKLALLDMKNKNSMFEDQDTKRADHYWRPTFPYHGKQKNLPKMFGMTVEQLRILDELYGTVNMDDSWSLRESYRPHWLDNVLNIPLSSLDPDTFKKLCEMSKGSNGQLINDMNLTDMKPKEIVNTFYEYRDHMQSYKDYLNARKSLQDVQTRCPNQSIFNEKDYPIRPKAGKKFVRFISGMTGQGRYGSQRLETWYDFQNYYNSNYRNCSQFVPNVGVSLTLGTIDMLKYLHDDATYWASFYQDAAKSELFQKALERVKDYVYVDKDMGLEMVSPNSIQDLKDEGTILEHCVSTYVNAIIGGKENIMFLRRSDMPGAPFYTVELVPPMDDRGNILDEHKKLIRQVHCHRNGDLTEEGQDLAFQRSGLQVYNKKFNIVEFLLKWAKAKKDIDPQSIKSKYGALCAIR